MAITTLDGYIGAAKQKITYVKTATATSVAANWHTLWNLAGEPGAGTFLNMVGTANSSSGRIVQDNIAGFPLVNTFGTGNTGYVTGFDFSNSLAGRFMIYDRVWEMGPINWNNVNRVVNLTPNASSYEYRVPLNSAGTRDWGTLGIWVDVSSQFSASASTISVRYINDTGTVSNTPATATLSAFITGRVFQLPLQAGDKGVVRVTDVSLGGVSNVAASFNVFLARILYTGARVNVANYSDVHSFEKLGMPVIDASAALAINYAADSTVTGVVDCIIEIANG